MDKGLDKFWKWMEEKGYGKLSYEGGEYPLELIFDSTTFIYASKQMLVGYMIQYIRDHKHWDECEAQYYSMPYDMDFRMSVWGKDHYKCFSQVIKLIDGYSDNKGSEVFDG
jgi:hypothetical protein